MLSPSSIPLFQSYLLNYIKNKKVGVLLAEDPLLRLQGLAMDPGRLGNCFFLLLMFSG